MTHHWMVAVLLIVTSDLLTPTPGVFSGESSYLFIDAVGRVARREAATASVFVPSAREWVEAAVAQRPGASVPVAPGIRGRRGGA